jgi:hypothetical protein
MVHDWMDEHGDLMHEVTAYHFAACLPTSVRLTATYFVVPVLHASVCFSACTCFLRPSFPMFTRFDVPTFLRFHIFIL